MRFELTILRICNPLPLTTPTKRRPVRYPFLNSALLKLPILRLLSLPSKYGGSSRDRTDDLMLAKHLLSQLSYAPKIIFAPEAGFEPTTKRLTISCSTAELLRIKDYFGTSSWTRTSDLHFISVLLYQLSYRDTRQLPND